MMRYVVGAKVKLPFFSQSSGGKKTLSYQIRKAMPLPLPTALLGALARAYSLWKIGCGTAIFAQGFQIRTRTYIDIGHTTLRILNGRLLQTAKLPSGSIVVQNSVILRRLLSLVRTPRDIQKSFKSILLGETPSDAMLREYMFSDELIIIFMTREESLADEIEKSIWLFERIGDTESLGSVVEVGRTQANRSSVNKVNTVFPRDFVSEFDGGIVVLGAKKVCFNPSGVDESEYVLPLRRRKDAKYGVWFYEGTEVNVNPAQGVEIWEFKLFGERIRALWKDSVSFL